MASCILNILNANWGGVVDNLRVIGILPPVAAAWTNAQGQRIAFEAGTAGEWVELNDQDFKVRSSDNGGGNLEGGGVAECGGEGVLNVEGVR
jgi:hypothetical protein